MAPSLRGAAIIGYYNKDEGDFEEHNKTFQMDEDGKWVLQDEPGMQPYGFVDLNAKVWFQKFLDDGVNERTYLVTEGYLWTSIYPEAQRILDKGNNQSMELDDKNIDAFWTKDSSGKPQFFIINEAIIKKLCILGEDYEPCFEGASIGNVQFSLQEEMQSKLYSMMEELKELMEKGGTQVLEEDIQAVETSTENEETSVEEVETPVEEVETTLQEEETSEEEEVEVVEKEPEKKEFSLEENPVYQELVSKYSNLQNSYAALQIMYNNVSAEKRSLEEQVANLTQFRNAIERKQKEDMIDSFYMLSNEDKKNVIDNIDTYSLDDIEKELSVICFRNKVSFSLEEEEAPISYNLNGDSSQIDSTPAWVKAALEVAKTMD
jgi:hypothetical protein